MLTLQDIDIDVQLTSSLTDDWCQLLERMS